MAKIVIVDENDRVIGPETKERSWKMGFIRRVVRVLIFNSKGQIYLQKRSSKMKLFPNTWDQSVGGHVDFGENYYKAAVRETKEELGIANIALNKITKFYLEENVNRLIIKAFNMVYEGVYDGHIVLQKEELSSGDWFGVKYIDSWMKKSPKDFAPACIRTFEEYWKAKKIKFG